VKVWDVGSGMEIAQCDVAPAGKNRRSVDGNLCWDPEGMRLAAIVGTEDKNPEIALQIWNAASGKSLQTIAAVGGPGDTDIAISLMSTPTFSPDGKLVAARLALVGLAKWPSDFDPTKSGGFGLSQLKQVMSLFGSRTGCVYLWEADTGNVLQQIKIAGAGGSGVVFNPDGTVLAVYDQSSGEIRLLDARTGQLQLTILGKREFQRALVAGKTGTDTSVLDFVGDIQLVFSPDGKYFATASRSGSINVWDATTGDLQLNLKGEGLAQLAFSADGKQLSAAAKHLTSWDLTANGIKSDFGFGSLIMSSEGRRGAQWETPEPATPPKGTTKKGPTTRVLRAWDVATWQPLFEHRQSSTEELYEPLAMSGDAKRLLTIRADSPLVFVGSFADALSSPRIFEYAMSLPGKQKKDESKISHIRILDASSGQATAELASDLGKLPILFFGHHGQRIASVDVGSLQNKDVPIVLKMRDLASGQVAYSIALSTEDGAPVFSPDWKWFGSLSAANQSGDGKRALKRWDTETGHQLPPVQLDLDKKLVGDPFFSPDGHTLAIPVNASNSSVGVRKDIWLFDVATGKRHTIVPCQATNQTLYALNPDGSRLASFRVDLTEPLGAPGRPGEVHVWDTASGVELLKLTSSVRLGSSLTFSSNGQKLYLSGNPGAIWDKPIVQMWDATPR
jgi:WD40 repeat protein